MAKGSKGAKVAKGKGSRRAGFRLRVTAALMALMFAPSAVLLWRGNLSVDDALVRLGGAGFFAIVGTALVAATLRPAPVRRAPAAVPAPAPMEVAASD